MEIGVHRLNNKEGNLRIPHFSRYRFTDLCMHLFHALSHPSLPLYSISFLLFSYCLVFLEETFFQNLDRSKPFRVLLFPSKK